jgi:hypothetical protein
MLDLKPEWQNQDLSVSKAYLKSGRHGEAGAQHFWTVFDLRLNKDFRAAS